jgi:alkylation response protein AidB-like acyl-CoA dehydrogenase
MDFDLTSEQRGFARSLDDLLAGSGTATVVRSWADGEPGAGLKLWQRLAELGVTGLLVPERCGGLQATPVDLVVAFEVLGRQAVPGPWVETVALLPGLLDGAADVEDLLAAVASGSAVLSVAAPPRTPYALDADVATRVLLLDGPVLRAGRVGDLRRSLDPARRLFEVARGDAVAELRPEAVETGFDLAALATGAQLLGLGESLLARSVDYVKARRQFGRPIGEYQAIKHALADVRIGLDFARPLVYAAALAVGTDTQARDVSAAKVKSADAAYRAARTALQVHGAIGYTAEHDLGLWLLRVRALVTAWGTSGEHRARVLARLVEPSPVVQPSPVVEPVETTEASPAPVVEPVETTEA